MRDLLCPIVFLYQNHKGIMFHINGYECGHTTLLYGKHNDSDLTQVILNSEDVFVTDFSKGSGTYDFFLQYKGAATYKTSFYVSTETDKEILTKIASYISSPEDSDYIDSIIESVKDVETDYLSFLIDKYRAVKDIQDYEKKSYWQILNAVEHYMNLKAITTCKKNASVTVTYTPFFEVFTEFAVEHIDIYYEENGHRCFLRRFDTDTDDINRCFVPDKLHYIDIYTYNELAVELMHYEPTEEGTAYFWKEGAGTISDTDTVLDDQELSYIGVELTDEEKGRIIEERTYQNIDAFCERLKVSADTRNTNLLYVTIGNYPLLARMRKKFYVSVCPAEAFPDAFYSIRYEIKNPYITIDIKADLLEEEFLLWVEDENHTVVSPYTRYDPEGSLDDYYDKENLLDMNDYKKNMLANFETTFGRGQSYSICDNITSSMFYGDGMTSEELRKAVTLKFFQEPLLNTELDYVIYFMMDNWLSNFNRNNSFFDTDPILEYSTQRIIFPPRDVNYILIVESGKPSNDEMDVEYCQSSSNSTITLDLKDNLMYNIYALDENTYERSGFIFINNIGEKKYYTGGIGVEVK